MEKVVVCVDFEKLTSEEWWTFALVAVLYNTKTSQVDVLAATEVGCVQQGTPEPGELDFWNKHEAAQRYNTELSRDVSRDEAERKVAETFQRLRTSYPAFLLVGDNISFDIPLLDGILTRQGLKPSAWRNESTYLHPLCTWSYRLALVHNETPVCLTWERQLLEQLIGRGTGTKHTPLFDCAATLTQFFRTLARTPNSKLTQGWKRRKTLRLVASMKR